MSAQQSKGNLDNVKHIVLVLSGKGGVGKSTVTTQLAQSLVRLGKRVGVLDVDICGPSIPRMFGVRNKDVLQCEDGWIPVSVDENRQLSIMSIGFLLPNEDDPIVWRGPRKNALIRQFAEDVVWGELDYLLIDTPPGTSDEHLAIIDFLHARLSGAVLVTTPQGVALNDVRKMVDFCEKVKIPVLGVVENMAAFMCPHCENVQWIFGAEEREKESEGDNKESKKDVWTGGRMLAEKCGLTMLGSLPLVPLLSEVEDRGGVYTSEDPNSELTKRLTEIATKVVRITSNAEAQIGFEE